MPTIKDDIKKLVAEVIEARREYDRLAYDEEEEELLGKPATTKQLATLERKLGKPLPPSYRAFLELHNGWADFDGDGAILSVEDHEKPWVKKRMQSFSDQFEEWGGKDPFKAGCLPVMLGETIHNYLVIDPTKPRPRGELDFVMYDLTERERRFTDFTSYLKNKLKLTKQLIKLEKEGVDEDADKDDED